MIKLAAIVPHPLILIPNIGKENQQLLAKTEQSYQKIKANLIAQKIDTIILISSHGPIRANNFSINLDQAFEINFKEFGDFSTEMKIAGDMELAQELRESLIADPRVQLINQHILDHGSAVPLYLLCNELKNIKVVPIYLSEASMLEHFEFGKEAITKLNKIKQLKSKKIAVIASGDLSHCLGENAPAGYSPKGAKFDQKLMTLLRQGNINDIVKIDNDILDEATVCGAKAMAVLLGMMTTNEYDTEILSYQAPFGIGNLAALLNITF